VSSDLKSVQSACPHDRLFGDRKRHTPLFRSIRLEWHWPQAGQQASLRWLKGRELGGFESLTA
jgi:hypothetical protein